MHRGRKDRVQTREQTAICKSEREACRGTGPANTFLSELPAFDAVRR